MSNRSEHPLYKTWHLMKYRCDSPKSGSYIRYGGRGISVCQQWQDSFGQFCADVGERPEGHQLDRIDNNGNYEPSNCRWVTPSQNCRNTRRTRWLTSQDGQTRAMAEWGEMSEQNNVVSARTFRARIHLGWTLEQALNNPRYKHRAA